MTNEHHPQTPIFSRLQKVAGTAPGDYIVGLILMSNFAVLYLRPQELFSPLSAVRLPVVVTTVCFACWVIALFRPWSMQMKLMTFFIAMEALRTFVGTAIFDDFVLNDFWQFHTLKDLAMQFFGLFFPMTVYLSSGSGLRLVHRACCATGVLLALYAASHGGVGPGGFLGDENDIGLVLLTFLPFPLIFALEAKLGFPKRLIFLLSSGLILLGIVSTSSRGTFVGLVCVMCYFFFRSKRKILLVLFSCLLTASVFPFLPDGYIEDMKTIKDTDEGTASIRRHYWKLATRVWLDPKHTLIGVGMKNTALRIGEYETPEDLELFPSSSGRAVHSIYFELLPDLGLWGVCMISLLVYRSVRSNRVLSKNIIRPLQTADVSGDEHALDDTRTAYLIYCNEQEFLKHMSFALNASFIAIFSAGAFISVLYYPILWTILTFSAMLERYANNLTLISHEIGVSVATEHSTAMAVSQE